MVEIAPPIPFAPPVTIATLSFNLSMVYVVPFFPGWLPGDKMAAQTAL
jgi:hypothetical protein